MNYDVVAAVLTDRGRYLRWRSGAGRRVRDRRSERNLEPGAHVVRGLDGGVHRQGRPGPESGHGYAGRLRLAGNRTGYLKGTLTLTGSQRQVPVQGQLHGQLIGLSIVVDTGHTLSGAGVVGYDPGTKRNTIGGTFSGPDGVSLGVWSYGPQTSAGGCLVGISTNGSTNPSRPGLCYIVD